MFTLQLQSPVVHRLLLHQRNSNGKPSAAGHHSQRARLKRQYKMPQAVTIMVSAIR